MNKLTKYTLLAIGINIAALFLFVLPFDLIRGKGNLEKALAITIPIALAYVVFQILLALAWLGNNKKKITGKAMLLSMAILFTAIFASITAFG